MFSEVLDVLSVPIFRVMSKIFFKPLPLSWLTHLPDDGSDCGSTCAFTLKVYVCILSTRRNIVMFGKVLHIVQKYF